MFNQFPDGSANQARKCFEIMLYIQLTDQGESTEFTVDEKKSKFRLILERLGLRSGAEKKTYKTIWRLTSQESHYNPEGTEIDMKRLVQDLMKFSESKLGITLHHPNDASVLQQFKQMHQDQIPEPQDIFEVEKSQIDEEEVIPKRRELGEYLTNPPICPHCENDISHIRFAFMPTLQVLPSINMMEMGQHPLSPTKWLEGHNRNYCPHCLKNEFIPEALETISEERREFNRTFLEQMMDDVINQSYTRGSLTKEE